MVIQVECDCCKGGKKSFTTAEGLRRPCPYCRDRGTRDKHVPDPSHKMTEWRTEVRCPGSTPRFYGVRNCTECGEEELEHPAGHFMNDLESRCPCANDL